MCAPLLYICNGKPSLYTCSNLSQLIRSNEIVQAAWHGIGIAHAAIWQCVCISHTHSHTFILSRYFWYVILMCHSLLIAERVQSPGPFTHNPFCWPWYSTATRARPSERMQIQVNIVCPFWHAALFMHFFFVFFAVSPLFFSFSFFASSVTGVSKWPAP